jgi:hypothetical protein
MNFDVRRERENEHWRSRVEERNCCNNREGSAREEDKILKMGQGKSFRKLDLYLLQRRELWNISSACRMKWNGHIRGMWSHTPKPFHVLLCISHVKSFRVPSYSCTSMWGFPLSNNTSTHCPIVTKYGINTVLSVANPSSVPPVTAVSFVNMIVIHIANKFSAIYDDYFVHLFVVYLMTPSVALIT